MAPAARKSAPAAARARSVRPGAASRPRVGISSCLLGEKVRYDGGDKRDPWLAGVLGRRVAWVPVCPELEVGMGVPREPVRLVGSVRAPRMIGIGSGRDWTARMRAYARRRVAALRALDLCGYVLKARSPSCGLGVPVGSPPSSVHGPQSGRGERAPGLFAAELLRAFPGLPVVDEDLLRDPAVRGRFVKRVFARHAAQRKNVEYRTPESE